MSESYIDIESISDLHELYGVGKPKHPLITVIDLDNNQINRPKHATTYRVGFYTIFCKKFTGTLRYGRSYYDFREGTLMFTAPGQIVSPSPELNIEEGWGLFFHPDMVNTGALGLKMMEYSFFNYEANEALHVSEDEKNILNICVQNIRKEYQQNIDKHTNGLIQANIELLLNYCSRFYDRQFYTREKVNIDVVQEFEKLIRNYFAQETLINSGLPNVSYFASRMNLSPNYLSDLLHRFTGKTTQEHIHIQLVEKAKALLWSTQKNVSEIAYMLGFEHPSHFTRLFKNKTGYVPSDYRLLN
ncbi:transcriptional regulator, AraC family [Mucilaginibacter lappiensis]|uniref:AraC-like DNA-binding protein n=1 Tax=Mucilaginibacter lappiensis TaxID=354630 RepID=A0ABR6PE11_9SPHI|nr:helix-turn-helix transcriptional regulator [Mucilaginibacter lappiensis]MBB6107474.1 AraC-like DNA-binding protein [Mucilaginibacter lappiensis]SIQ07367.1 transcriptional regulator, AraC family [Mucilaginibacter lappiensis]